MNRILPALLSLASVSVFAQTDTTMAQRTFHLGEVVLVKAVDGYEVIYALPEVDPEFTSNTVLLTTHVDGNPLPKGEGPFRLVNPADKRPARWIREITTIRILFSKD